ncbi:APC family permease [Deinococcus aquatilis]|uniref:APC family permease n=1 Tax=Deinococcus aquatilis TaxID=519440 RepID=UPI0003623CD8|nr:APC family permease [Deinococcus aquatilis]
MTVKPTTAGSSPAPVPGRPKLGLWGVIMVIYFTVAGGAFGIEGVVAGSAPGMAIALILITPLIWSIPTALMVTELSTAMPVEGGYYVWVNRALGRFWGFTQGWISWLYGLVIAASFAALFAEYTSSFLRLAFGSTIIDDSAAVRWIVAALLITGFGFLNIRGAKAVGDSSKVFAVMVFAPFITMFVLAGVRWAANPAPFWLPVTPPDTGIIGAFGLGLFVVMYNFLGWDSISTILGEIERPLKVVPKAMLIAVPLIIFAYLLPVLAGLTSGVEYTKWGDTAFFPELATAIGGRWLGIWVAVGGMFCAAGLFNAMVFSNSRLPFVLASDGYLPAALVARHPRFGTPMISIIACCVIYALLVVGPFQTLAVTTVLLYGVSLLLQFTSLVVLRVRVPEMVRPFRIPGGLPGVIGISLLPALIIVVAVVTTARDEGTSFLLLAAALLVSAPLAFLITSALFKRGSPDRLTHELSVADRAEL